MKKVLNYLLVLLMTISIVPVNIKAAVGSINVDGATIEVGEEKTLNIGLSSGIAAVDGYVESNDPSCVEVVSVTSSNGSGNYFMEITTSVNPLTTGGSIKIKGLKVCETTLKIYDASVTTQSEEADEGVSFTSGLIKVGEAAPAKSSDATLSSLTVSKGSLSPAFSSNVTTYTVNVDNDVDSIDVAATVNDSKATVSGTGTKSLAVGDNSISVIVTAEDGTQKTYSIKVTRAQKADPGEPEPEDATLSSITVSKGSLSPEFDKDTTTYTVNVDNDVDSIDINATASDSNATVSGTGTKSLSEGDNTYDITVTAKDGTKKIYTIKVVRSSSSNPGGKDEPSGPSIDDDRSNDNKLKSLEVTNYSLDPEFNADNTSYVLEVDNSVTSIDLTAIANDEKATVNISGNTDLKEGINNVNVTVTAEDGSQRVYTVKVIRKSSNNQAPAVDNSKSSENRLSKVIISNADITPTFDANNTTYNVIVANNVDSLDFSSIVKMDSKSSYSIFGNEDFKIGETKVVTIVVTAENGSTRTYTFNVKKSDKDSNNKLSGLTINGGSLTPGFNPNTTSYTTKVSAGTKSISLSATPENSNAKVEYSVNGGAFTTDGNLNLEDGNNLVIVKVTDENGFTQLYTVNVEKPSNTFSLFGIKIPRWLGYLLLLLLLLLIGWLIFLVLKKRKEKEVAKTQAVPNIEIKPEFNFNSKNEDNDSVDDGGVLNQSSNGSASSQDNDGNGIDYNKSKEIPYDPYDEVVTKEEIIDAINEKDPDKLKMLYKQEMLNREKDELKEKEGVKK
ncbi:MAG: cadherin-like beta sandwich domain-containing protein [Bacilli bacterium]|nr:cadherin-like beta sandwich domain-containing protein [Bacilli bacterium]